MVINDVFHQHNKSLSGISTIPEILGYLDIYDSGSSDVPGWTTYENCRLMLGHLISL